MAGSVRASRSPHIGNLLSATRDIGQLFAREGLRNSDAALATACELLARSVGAEIAAVRSVDEDGLAHFVGGWASSAILDGPQEPLQLQGHRVETPFLARSFDEMPISADESNLKSWQSQSPDFPQTLFCPVRSADQTLGYICLVAPSTVDWGLEITDGIMLAAGAIGQFLLRVWSAETQQRQLEVSSFLRRSSHRFHRVRLSEAAASIDAEVERLAVLLRATAASMWKIDAELQAGERLFFWGADGVKPRSDTFVSADDVSLPRNVHEPDTFGIAGSDLTYMRAPGMVGEKAHLYLVFARPRDIPWQSWELQDVAAFVDHIALMRHKLATESQLAAAFDGAPRGITMRDANGAFLDCNQAFLDFLGLKSKDELAGPYVDLVQVELLSPELLAQFRNSRDAPLNGVEVPYKHADGSTRWGRISQALIGVDNQIWLTHVEDVTSYREALDVIRYRATTDALTGSANRYAITEMLEGMLENSSSGGRDDAASCAVILLDLDDFKFVNDAHGHAAGDQVLTEVSKRLQVLTRVGDVVGRYGGDEFVVVMQGPVTAAEAVSITRRLRSSFDRVVKTDGGDIPVSASIGLAVAVVDDTPDTMLARADAAMYNEKFEAHLRRTGLRATHGRSTVIDLRGSEPKVHSAAPVAEEEGVRQLESALRDGQIVFWGQPIVHLETGKPLGVELLARWPQRDGTVLSPSSFIPLAERSGLVVDLGRQALAMAGRLFDRWKDDPQFRNLGVNVNISPLHLGHRLIEDVHTLVDSLPDGSQLGLEFVESALVGEARDHLRTLDALMDSGVRVIIDDFGIGHSSLSRLQLFPASNMKLDKSFLYNVDDNEERRRFFRAVVRLLGSAAFPVTVEGIENEEQLDLARRSRAVAGQGFHFARPAPVGNLEHMLRKLWSDADAT